MRQINKDDEDLEFPILMALKLLVVEGRGRPTSRQCIRHNRRNGHVTMGFCDGTVSEWTSGRAGRVFVG